MSSTPQTPNTDHQWSLVESQIEPLQSPVSPQHDLKSDLDLADALTKIETERRDRNAHDAPQAWEPDDAPICIPDEDGMHVRPGDAPEAGSSDRPTLGSPTSTDASVSTPKGLEARTSLPEPRIMGFKKRTFWILLIVTLVLIAGIVGGSIGGVLAQKDKHKEPPKPTVKYKMSFSLQTWEAANQTGRTQIFYQEGQYRTAFRARAYDWLPGRYNDTSEWLVCSMAFCFGDHKIGFYASTPHVGQNWNWNGTEYGDSVVVKCARTFADPGCPIEGTSVVGIWATAPVFDPGETPVTTRGGRKTTSNPTASTAVSLTASHTTMTTITSPTTT